MSFIRCEGLVKIYKAADLEVFALQGLDLQVAAGEVMAIIGNSGSGKSTLMNVLGGLDTPSAGKCTVDSYDLLRLTERDRVRYQREVVGFVWQNSARNLLSYLTAIQNIEMPMMLAGKVGRPARQWAMELLTAVGLADRANHVLTHLSGGEQQRVAIALSLANQPKLLLADEPTGAVDTATGNRILEILREVNQRFGTTVVIVTHDRSLARAVDRYVLIRDGRVAQEAVRRAVASPDTNGKILRGGTIGAEEGQIASHEELVVVDSAGRLQIPREILDQVGLGGRARVDVESDRIIIRKPL